MGLRPAGRAELVRRPLGDRRQVAAHAKEPAGCCGKATQCTTPPVSKESNGAPVPPSQTMTVRPMPPYAQYRRSAEQSAAYTKSLVVFSHFGRTSTCSSAAACRGLPQSAGPARCFCMARPPWSSSARPPRSCLPLLGGSPPPASAPRCGVASAGAFSSAPSAASAGAFTPTFVYSATRLSRPPTSTEVPSQPRATA